MVKQLKNFEALLDNKEEEVNQQKGEQSGKIQRLQVCPFALSFAHLSQKMLQEMADEKMMYQQNCTRVEQEVSELRKDRVELSSTLESLKTEFSELKAEIVLIFLTPS